MGEKVSFVVPTKSGKSVLVGKPNGIDIVELEFDKHTVKNVTSTVIAKVEDDLPHTRFNDGKCDNNGILWAGTMHQQEEDHAGSLYSFTYDEKTKQLIPKKHLDKVGISNGITWNRKGDTMYFIDSFRSSIFAFDYVAKGLEVELQNQRSVFDIPKEWNALPDGMAIDSQDKLWVAFYGLGAVVRIDPEESDNDKKVLYRIDVPDAQKITACAFAGDDWSDLYITSACQQLDEETMKKYPKSGYLYNVNLREYLNKVGAKGVAFEPFYTL